jgi:dynein heavy chain 1
MAAVTEVNGNGVPESAAPPIDVQVLVAHLTRLLQATLEASDEDLHRPESIFGSVLADQTLQRCASFAQEAQASSLYIQKLLLYPSDQNDGSSPGMPPLMRFFC